MGELDQYVKDIESENERLHSQLDVVLLDKERESRRKIFIWVRETLDMNGKMLSHYSTLSADESRKWIRHIGSHVLEKTLHMSVVCWAHSKDKDATVPSILVWSCHWERKENIRTIWKLTQSSRYSGNGGRKPVTDKRLQTLRHNA